MEGSGDDAEMPAPNTVRVCWDIANYVSLPSLSLDSWLKSSKAEIELISDISLINLSHRNIRGGFTSVNKLWIKADNKYINPAFDAP